MLRLNLPDELIRRINDGIDGPAEALLCPAERLGYLCQVYASQDQEVHVAGSVLFRFYIRSKCDMGGKHPMVIFGHVSAAW